MPDFYIVILFFYKNSKQARVPTFVWLFRDDATTAKSPGCDERTNLRLRNFAVVPLMPTRDVHRSVTASTSSSDTRCLFHPAKIPKTSDRVISTWKRLCILRLLILRSRIYTICLNGYKHLFYTPEWRFDEESNVPGVYNGNCIYEPRHVISNNVVFLQV